MPSTLHDLLTLASRSYAVLRYEGAPPPRAREALGLAEATAASLERLFQARTGGGDDLMRPRFARHAAHVAAVLAEGGYPVMPQPCRRRRAR
jgi:hypothetical protein